MKNTTPLQTMTRATFYLRVNGIAATALRTKKQCLQMAERGHQGRPDAVVELIRVDPVTDTDTVISRLYN
jgi:hypothetical protein